MTKNPTKRLLVYMYENDVHPDFTVLNPFFIKHGINEVKAKAILNQLESEGILYAEKSEGYDLLGGRNSRQTYFTFKNTQVKAFLKIKGGVDYVYTTYIIHREMRIWGVGAALLGAITGGLIAIIGNSIGK